MLTVSELRTTLDRLEASGFFVRVTPSPRRCYYAKEISHEEASAAVRTLLGRKSMLAQRREADRKLMEGVSGLPDKGL